MRLQIIIAFLLILTSYTGKSQNTIPGYYDNDVQKLQTFFEQSDGTTTNGLKINALYSVTDPLTWTGVTWDNSSPKRVTSIIFNASLYPSGILDVSNFSSLTTLEYHVSGNTQTYGFGVNTDGDLSLTRVSLDYLDIQSLDVITNTALTYLSIRENHVPNLDFTNNTALTYLDCSQSYSQTTNLDFSKNTALTSLSCTSCNQTALDVNKNLALTHLDCSDNQLTVLDVRLNTALTNFACSNNQLTNLDVTQNTALTDFACNNNQLTNLDISKNTALVNFWCYFNKLTSLDIKTNTALNLLNCSDNQLTNLDVRTNTKLTVLYFSNNQVTTIDLTQNIKLGTLACSFNKLTSIDASAASNMLQQLQCDHNNITSLDLTPNTGLTYLYCNNNLLTSLNIKANALLKTLQCDSNELKFSDMINSSYFEVIPPLSPQRPFIPLGLDTAGGTMAAATGGTINLSAETNIAFYIGTVPPPQTPAITNFTIWKKAWNGTISDVTAQCTFDNAIGSIKLPPTAGEYDSLFITMSNTTYPDFVEQTTPSTALGSGMRTRMFRIVGTAFLPIELLSFTANLNNNKVDLAWSTASEKNNAFFTVERSTNNKDWESIAKVDGAGNSNTQLNYSTIDANPLSGVSYYGLKQTDFDGKFEYSKTVVIDRNVKTTIELYPNPANNEISVTGNEDDLNSIKIYNSLGQDVTKYTNYSTSNTKQKQIDISKLTTGIYILTTKNTTNRLIVK